MTISCMKWYNFVNRRNELKLRVSKMVQQMENVAVQEVPEEVEVCQHHWLIKAADGPLSAGICQTCGEIKEFKNYVETATWGDTRLINRQDPVPATAVMAAKMDSWEDE